ncbi:MAG: glycosyl hydrolase family 28-related protein [Flammeovirgaceae bacterium]
MHKIAQPIPESRMVNWKVAGCKTMADPEASVMVTLGTDDDHKVIQDAIDSFNGKPGKVVLPAGTFNINQHVRMKSGVVLEGQGATKTTLAFKTEKSRPCIFVEPLSLGAQKLEKIVRVPPKMGATSVKVADTSSFKVGDYAEIRQDNGSWNKVPTEWSKYAVGQFVKITNITDTEIHFQNPLRIDYDLNLHPTISAYTPITKVGLKGFKISRNNNPDQASNNNIHFKYAADCWVEGIESNVSVAAHVNIDHSTNITIRGCYMHHAYDYSGVGTKGYGVMLINHTGECLIENNCFQHLRHPMIVKQGANGNVFAYNYSCDEYRSEMMHHVGGSIQLHGHYAFCNLFEGNEVENIWVDHTWGPSGPYNTFFRNRVTLHGIYYSPHGENGNNHNWVANEITHKGLNYGFFKINGSGHIKVANGHKKASKDTVEVSSYVYDTRPYFWVYPETLFATIGQPSHFDKDWIPAHIRYSKGDFTCIHN